jgi:hypothetical protein
MQNEREANEANEARIRAYIELWGNFGRISSVARIAAAHLQTSHNYRPVWSSPALRIVDVANRLVEHPECRSCSRIAAINVE